jgi:hypothetical protein
LHGVLFVLVGTSPREGPHRVDGDGLDRLEESDLLWPIRLPLAKLLPNVLTFAELFVLLSYITGYCSKVVNFHCELFFELHSV